LKEESERKGGESLLKEGEVIGGYKFVILIIKLEVHP